MRFGIRITKGGNKAYLKEVLREPMGYGKLKDAASTRDLSVMSDWFDYVNNDLTNGSIDSFDVVRFDVDVVVVNINPQLKDAAKKRALEKLNPADKRALGL